VVGLATILLGALKKTRLTKYDALLAVARKNVAGGDVLFLPALSLLFVLGLVAYRSKTDAFEYSGAG
jgi:hypothetical protein